MPRLRVKIRATKFFTLNSFLFFYAILTKDLATIFFIFYILYLLNEFMFVFEFFLLNFYKKKFFLINTSLNIFLETCRFYAG